MPESSPSAANASESLIGIVWNEPHASKASLGPRYRPSTSSKKRHSAPVIPSLFDAIVMRMKSPYRGVSAFQSSRSQVATHMETHVHTGTREGSSIRFTGAGRLTHFQGEHQRG